MNVPSISRNRSGDACARWSSRKRAGSISWGATVIVVVPFEMDVKSSLEGSRGDRRYVRSDTVTRSVHQAIGRNPTAGAPPPVLIALGGGGPYLLHACGLARICVRPRRRCSVIE